MKYIDSNIIAYAFYNNPFQEKCQHCILAGGMTSSLALIEAFNIIEMQSSKEYAIKVIKSILKSPISIIPIDVNVIFEALKRREKYNALKFLDLIHYTIALLQNCESIVTYDKDFDELDMKREEP
jgi:predicted nucleic acid-binding protein